MMYGLIFTLTCFVFFLLLSTVYFSKHGFASMKNKLYRYLLIINCLLIISEILAIVGISYFDNDLLKELLLRVHWLTGIIFFYFLFYYLIAFFTPPNVGKFIDFVKLNFITKLMFYITVIATVIYMLLPFKIGETITYVPGLAAYFVFGYCVFCLCLALMYYFKHRKEIEKYKKTTLIQILLVLTIVMGMQLILTNIAFSPICVTIELFILYFNIENPDLRIIRELNELRVDISRSNQTTNEFLSNMSHKIKNPMKNISRINKELKNLDVNSKEKITVDLEEIITSGNELLEIVNNIIDISKIETGKENLDFEEYNLKDIILDLLNKIKAPIAEKSLGFNLEIDDNIPTKLYGDASKIKKVLLNLLMNSIKFTDNGKINFVVSCNISGIYCNLTFKVIDSGCGIKQEDLEDIFKKFSYVSENHNGVGLGLPISKKYINLMGGTISVESEYSVGSTFTVELRQKIINNTPITELEFSDKKNAVEYFDCSNYKVLVVDDDKLGCKLFEEMLERYKFNVETINSGKECVYKFKAEEKFDMIFIDSMMEDMNGSRVVEIIKKLEGYEVPPLVVVTANVMSGIREKYIRDGFDEYISKPIDLYELNKIIKKYFYKDVK